MKLLSQVLCQFRSTQSIIIYFLRCSICSSFLRLKELTAGAEAPLHPQGPWSRPQQPKLLATPGWGSSLHSWSWPPGQAPLIRNVLVKAALHMIGPHTAVNLCPWPLPQQGWHVGGNTPGMKEEWGPSPAEEASPEALKAATLLTLRPDLLAALCACLGITPDAVLGSAPSPTCLGKPSTKPAYKICTHGHPSNDQNGAETFPKQYSGSKQRNDLPGEKMLSKIERTGC